MVKVVNGLIKGLGNDKNVLIPKEAKAIWDICYEDFISHNDIESITVEEGNENFYEENNCLLRKIDANTTELVLGCKNSKIPTVSGDLIIGFLAFNGVEIDSVCLPENVVEIDASAFANTKITQINLPQKLKHIGNFAFMGSQLTSIYIPADVTEIGIGAFAGCNALKTIIVDNENDIYYSANNCLIQKADTMLIACVKNTEVPYEVKTVAPATFYAMAADSVITMHENVEKIHEIEALDIPLNFEFPITFNVPEDSYAHCFAESNELKYIIKYY